jgi:predicted nucleic acid-binding Zn ribbon protein
MTALDEAEKLEMLQLRDRILREAQRAGTYNKACIGCNKPIPLGKRMLCDRCESFFDENQKRFGIPDRRALLRRYGLEDWE